MQSDLDYFGGQNSAHSSVRGPMHDCQPENMCVDLYHISHMARAHHVFPLSFLEQHAHACQSVAFLGAFSCFNPNYIFLLFHSSSWL